MMAQALLAARLCPADGIPAPLSDSFSRRTQPATPSGPHHPTNSCACRHWAEGGPWHAH